MKQISQSQFISISDTLCEIVKGLNESQIAATFESVVDRLCSSFDTVVIPPMSAIKKCLDHLVKSLKLDFVNGSYHLKRTMPLKPREKLTIGLQEPVETQTAVPNASARPLKEKNRNRRQNLKGHSFENGKRTKTKTVKSTVNSDKHQHEALKCNMHMKEELSSTKKHGRKTKKNKVVKSSSLKVRKPSHCIPRRQYSYEQLHSHVENQKELECKKQIKKRNSFLGRISRLFQIDDEKLTSSDEVHNDLDVEGCHDGWERIVMDEQVKLIPNKVETQKKHTVSREKKSTRKIPKRVKDKSVANIKVIDKKSHAEKLSVRNKNAQYNKSGKLRFNKLHELQSSGSSTNVSSDSRSPKWTNKNFADRDKRPVDHHFKGKFRRRREKEESPDQYSLSSCSDSSFSHRSNSDSSLSSGSSVELTRKSFRYSEEETTDVESLQACQKDGSSDFCSTQAICGDLELSTLSINQTKKATLSSSDTSFMKHVQKHSAVIPGLNKTRTLNHDSQQNNLRGRNLRQLIGIL